MSGCLLIRFQWRRQWTSCRGGFFDGGVVDEVLEILAGNKSSASRKHTFTLKYDICGSDFIFWDFLKMCSDCLHTSAAINVVAAHKKKVLERDLWVSFI